MKIGDFGLSRAIGGGCYSTDSICTCKQRAVEAFGRTAELLAGEQKHLHHLPHTPRQGGEASQFHFLNSAWYLSQPKSLIIYNYDYA